MSMAILILYKYPFTQVLSIYVKCLNIRLCNRYKAVSKFGGDDPNT